MGKYKTLHPTVREYTFFPVFMKYLKKINHELAIEQLSTKTNKSLLYRHTVSNHSPLKLEINNNKIKKTKSYV